MKRKTAAQRKVIGENISAGMYAYWQRRKREERAEQKRLGFPSMGAKPAEKRKARG